MSVPVAISVWFLLPDYPHNTKAWYITEDDQRLAMQRAAKQNRAEITGVLDLKLVKRMFGNWRWWILCLTYIFVRRLSIVSMRSTADIRMASTATHARRTATSPSTLVSLLLFCQRIQVNKL